MGACPDCGAQVFRRSGRCRACADKELGRRRTGANNPTWKGGRTMHRDGYWMVRQPDGTYRFEHHVVWEQTHGRPLPKGWVVHHLNGIKTDNRPVNLAGMPRQEHHKHPREALRPYEHRIAELEDLVRSLGGDPGATALHHDGHGHLHGAEPGN